MTPAETTADLKARIGRRYRKMGQATGIPQHVVMFEVPVDSVETRADLEAEARLAAMNNGASLADLGPGYYGGGAAGGDRPAKRRRIDALAVGQWGTASGRLLGFEVKATRSDLLAELRTPLKAEAGARYCHEWWLVVPDMAIVAGDPLEVVTGLGWGVLARHGKGLTVKVASRRRDPDPPTASLLAAVVASATTQAIDNDASGLVATGRRLAARYTGETAERLAEHLTHPVDPDCPACYGAGDVWPAYYGIAWADRHRYEPHGCPLCGPPYRRRRRFGMPDDQQTADLLRRP